MVGNSAQIKDEASSNVSDQTVASIAVVPRTDPITLATVTTSDSNSILQHDVCFKEKTVTTCPTPTHSIARKSAAFFLQVTSKSTTDALDYNSIAFNQTVSVKGKCTTSALKDQCGQYYTTFGTTISAASAKKKSWLTYENNAGGWEVTFDDKYMGNKTLLTLNAANHDALNTLSNTWTNGATVTSLDATVVSLTKKAQGFAVHPSTGT
jgi:hypothetical protein